MSWTFAVMVMESPTVGAGLENVMSVDVIVMLGLSLAKALSANAVE